MGGAFNRGCSVLCLPLLLLTSVLFLLPLRAAREFGTYGLWMTYFVVGHSGIGTILSAK